MRIKAIVTTFIVLIILFFEACSSTDDKTFTPGEIWPDNNGVHINAHGGGILFHNDSYYLLTHSTEGGLL